MPQPATTRGRAAAVSLSPVQPRTPPVFADLETPDRDFAVMSTELLIGKYLAYNEAGLEKLQNLCLASSPTRPKETNTIKSLIVRSGGGTQWHDFQIRTARLGPDAAVLPHLPQRSSRFRRRPRTHRSSPPVSRRRSSSPARASAPSASMRQPRPRSSATT